VEATGARRGGHARRAGPRRGSRRDGRALAEARTGSQLRACVRTRAASRRGSSRPRGWSPRATGCCAATTAASPPSSGCGTRRPSSRPAWCAIRGRWPPFASRTTCSPR
jgi:hypothetical protein